MTRNKKRLLVGVAVVICLAITAAEFLSQTSLEEYKVARSGEGVEEEVPLEYEITEGEKGHMTVTVPKVIYTEAEVQTWMTQAEEVMDQLILGENQSLTHVTKPLSLVTEIPDSPVLVSWNSSDMAVLDYDGVPGSEIPIEGSTVTLTAELSLQGYTDSLERTVVVYPSGSEMGTGGKLQDMIREENEGVDGKEYYLPRLYDGKEIVWKRQPVYTGPKLLLLVIVFAAAGSLMEKRQKQEQEEKRKEALMLDYPEIISKLKLLMSAGLSIRKSFERISADYERQIETRRLPRKEAYDTITVICREMQSGVEEIVAYEHLGTYCNCQGYKALSTILTQNLRRGSRGIIELMEHEADAAFEDRKRQARVKGDKAGTRLLFPMVLMLGIVMVIIMVPAYLSFMG